MAVVACAGEPSPVDGVEGGLVIRMLVEALRRARERERLHAARANAEVMLIDVALKDQCTTKGERRPEHIARVHIQPVKLITPGRRERLQEHSVQIRRVSKARVAA